MNDLDVDPPRFPPRLADCRARLGGVARSWQKMRASGRSGAVPDYEYEQAEHWFRCLVWVTGFERLESEPIDAYIARACRIDQHGKETSPTPG